MVAKPVANLKIEGQFQLLMAKMDEQTIKAPTDIDQAVAVPKC